MEDLITHVPQQYKRPTPVRRFDDKPAHDLNVICNGKLFRCCDYPSHKAWREAVARECGSKNPDYNPEKAMQDSFGRI